MHDVESDDNGGGSRAQPANVCVRWCCSPLHQDPGHRSKWDSARGAIEDSILQCTFLQITYRDERSSAERSIDERSNDERSSADRSSDERSSDERSSVERSSDERSSVERSSDERSSIERSSDERSGAG